jgi:1,4-dihydroxy-2-naphthoate octaprenyltransferase
MNILPWIQAARIKTLAASVIPIISSIAILPQSKQIYIKILLLTLLSALIIQIVTNYINDLYDFLKGADQNRIGPARMLQSGLITEKHMKTTIVILTIVGICSGIPLVIKGGWPIVIIGLSSFLFAYLYTAGPFALAYHGLGDIFVFIYFGLIAVSGSYYLQVNTVNIGCLYLGISIGCKNVLLLIINNLRDYENDLSSQKKTLIVKFGYAFGKTYALIIILLSYASIFLLSVQVKNYNIFYLMLFSTPISISIIKDVFYKEPLNLNSTLGKVSGLLIIDCMFLFIGQLL